MVLKCITCKATALLKKDFKHASDCKKKRLTRTCSESGTHPHTK